MYGSFIISAMIIVAFNILHREGHIFLNTIFEWRLHIFFSSFMEKAINWMHISICIKQPSVVYYKYPTGVGSRRDHMSEEREMALRLLKTAGGQIEGIIKMIEDNRYCVDNSNMLMACTALLKKQICIY